MYNIPYRIRLFVMIVERTDILPQIFFNSNHVFQLLDHWRAEIHGEIRIIVIASCMPTLCSIILVCFFVVFQWLDGDGVEVIVTAFTGIVYLARFGFL